MWQTNKSLKNTWENCREPGLNVKLGTKHFLQYSLFLDTTLQVEVWNQIWEGATAITRVKKKQITKRVGGEIFIFIQTCIIVKNYHKYA